MRTNNKKYGFVITLPEYGATIPTLWQETVKFAKANPQYLPANNSLKYLATDQTRDRKMSDNPPPEYNNCHFWSNFEVGDLNFWRGEAYSKYFDHLDKTGGFFYERWGDAPVHSIAAALFLNTNEIHHFADGKLSIILMIIRIRRDYRLIDCSWIYTRSLDEMSSR